MGNVVDYRNVYSRIHLFVFSDIVAEKNQVVSIYCNILYQTRSRKSNVRFLCACKISVE